MEYGCRFLWKCFVVEYIFYKLIYLSLSMADAGYDCNMDKHKNWLTLGVDWNLHLSFQTVSSQVLHCLTYLGLMSVPEPLSGNTRLEEWCHRQPATHSQSYVVCSCMSETHPGMRLPHRKGPGLLTTVEEIKCKNRIKYFIVWCRNGEMNINTVSSRVES